MYVNKWKKEKIFIFLLLQTKRHEGGWEKESGDKKTDGEIMKK